MVDKVLNFVPIHKYRPQHIVAEHDDTETDRYLRGKGNRVKRPQRNGVAAATNLRRHRFNRN